MITKEQTYDEQIQEILMQAIREVAIEDSMKEVEHVDDKTTKGWETKDSFYIEQDIQDILDDAKLERDARNDGLIKPEAGTRKFATVPIATIIDYYNKYGIDIMDAEVSRDQWEMAKFRMWIQKNHPELMVRDPGKTKYFSLK